MALPPFSSSTPQASFTRSGKVKQTVYNVMDYGAKGDGSTDDTTAIQLAIDTCNTAGGGVVWFPIGTYIVSKSLFYRGFSPVTNFNITFRGEARSASIIKLANGTATNIAPKLKNMICGSSNAYTPLTPYTLETDNTFNMFDLTVDYNGANQTINDVMCGLQLDNRGQNSLLMNCIFKNVFVPSFARGTPAYGIGINNYDSRYCKVIFCTFENCDEGLWETTYAQGNLLGMYATGNRCYNITDAGIYYESGTSNVIIGNYIDTCKYGIETTAMDTSFDAEATITANTISNASTAPLHLNSTRNGMNVWGNEGSFSDYLGIGTDTPGAHLNIVGNQNAGTRTAHQLRLGSGSNSWEINRENVTTGRLMFQSLSGSAPEVLSLTNNNHVGVGSVTAPTAFLHVAASTTSEASIRINNGVAPTSPNDGDLWYDGAHIQANLGSTTYQIDQQTAIGSASGDLTGAYPNPTVVNLHLSGDTAIGHKFTSVTDPTNPQDAATKNYVDSIAQGLDGKISVKALSVSNVTLSGTQTIDGVSCGAGDRVLLTGQTTASQNGIWIVQSGSWTRPTDFASGSSQLGAFVFVEAGTASSSSGWMLTGSTATTVDTTSETWTQFSGAGEITAGTGLSKSGNTISLSSPVSATLGGTGVANNAANTITFNGNFGLTLTLSATTSLTLPTSGTVTALGNSATGSGAIVLANSPSLTTPSLDAATGLSLALTNTSANGLVVGPSGSTNPVLQVDSSTASAATGIAIQGLAAGSGVNINALSSGTNEQLAINPKGNGTLFLANGSSNSVIQAGNSSNAANIKFTIRSTNANAFTVGPNTTTNPTLQIDSSTSSAATGIKIKSAAATAGIAISVISSGSNENLTMDAKGSGTITLGGSSTGNIVLGSASSNFVNFARTAITAIGASTPSFLTNGVGGAGGPTTATQFGWLEVQVAGTSAWIPIWH